MISTGDWSACGIRSGGGEIHCWGDDTFGLVTETPGGAFTDVAVAQRGACGVRADGALVCWGSSVESMSLPEGEFRSVDLVDKVSGSVCGVRTDGALTCAGRLNRRGTPEGSFTSLAVGPNFACAIRDSGEVACWPGGGDFNYGQIPLGGRFIDIAAHEQFACGIRVGGDVACWGPENDQVCLTASIGTCAGWGNDPLPAGPFTSISAAPPLAVVGTVCGVREDGTIKCWNDNRSVARPPAGRFATVHANGGVACATRVGGEAACWGPVGWLDETPAGAFTAVAGGPTHACGLRPEGHVECWGSNNWAAATPPPGQFTAIDAASHVTCAIDAGGAAQCWGLDIGGEPPPGRFTAIDAVDTYDGTYACGLRPDGSAECWGRRAIVLRLSPEWIKGLFATPDFRAEPWRDSYPGGSFATVSASGGHACGIRPGGQVLCWNPAWPPGAGDADTAPAPPEPRVGVPRELTWVHGEVPGGPYTALSSGWYHTCGLQRDGAVQCWGDATLPVAGTFRSVDVDWNEACGIGTDGQTRCWRLGRSVGTEPHAIAPLAPGEDIVETQRGNRVRCVLLADGAIVCEDLLNDTTSRREGPYERYSIGWGLVLDPSRQEYSMDALRPNADTPGYAVYTSEAAENYTHTCATRRDGTVACWGSNTSGQIELPPAWRDDPPYSDITAGFAHTCAIGASGEAICWGDDRYDQTHSPPGNFTSLSAGQWHTCGLRTDGNITCWGDGTADRDQDYDEPPDDAPTEPPAGPFTAVAAGFWHTCALRPNGTATCWLSY